VLERSPKLVRSNTIAAERRKYDVLGLNDDGVDQTIKNLIIMVFFL